MAKIIRIVSADGKKVISKILPAVPSHFKVPAGAHVEIVDQETGKRESIGRYINDNTGHDKKDDDGNAQAPRVTIEYVDEWPEAQAWLDYMADTASADLASADWFHALDKSSGNEVLGFDRTPLLIGGLVGAGAVGAVALAGGGGGGTKDTVAPVAPSGLDLATEDDVGTSSTDNFTSKSTGLTISGTAEAGASVELFDGSTSLGTTTASSTGTFTMDIDLAVGVHSIIARATDAAGNVSAASTALQIGIDQTPPAVVTALNLAAADDTGVSSTDNITTNNSGLTITGNADAAVTVELFDGATSLGKVLSDSSGLFQLDIALGEGVHNITAVSHDLAGNESGPSAALQITVDRTLPAAPSGLDLDPADDDGVSTTDNITSQTSGLTVTGLAEAGSSVALLDGTGVIATVVAGSNGLFSANLALDLGVHDISARSTDVAGNIGPISALLTITIVEPNASLLDNGGAGTIA